ncbi:MAG: aminotransferase class V-fold PLP-dependent enzyme [Rhodoluna sp.]
MSYPLLEVLGNPLERETALALDEADELASFRQEFFIKDENLCYLDGNSLGRLPKKTIESVNHFLTEEWGTELVDGWSHWIDEAQPAGDLLGRATLGAAAGQVLVCDTTSVNFYQLCVAALKARPGRNTIIIDSANFPTDRFILQGIAEQFGLNLITLDTDGSGGPGSVKVNTENELVTAELLAPFLSQDVALVTIQVVNYRSGSRQNIKAITDLVRSFGGLVVWDASHAGGSVELDFDANGVDLAVGCTYKYGNSGPGSPAWLYVRKEFQDRLNVPIQGWFAQDDQFTMGPFFERNLGIRGFQIASPSIMGIRAVQTSYEMIERAGIARIAKKAAIGTELMIALFDAWLAPLGFELLTPRDPSQRGGHITVSHPEAKRIAAALREFVQVIPDYRKPNTIRLAISPLPTSYTEVFDGFTRIRDSVERKDYEKIKDSGNRVT